MNLAEELRDDFLTCNICFEEYREPKQLPCLHTFCRQCLGKYICGKVEETPGIESFPCPFCRKVIHIPPASVTATTTTTAQQGVELSSWADSFPNNFLLSQLSSKLKEKAAASSSSPSSSNCPNPNPSSSTDLLHDSTADRESEPPTRAKCSDHPQYPLVGYCTRQRRGVCEECCVHRHSDCIRSHVRERESRLLAEERQSECLESLGALQIKLEGIKDRISSQETDLAGRKEQLTTQTDAALSDMKSKLDLFFSQQKRELSTKLENLLGKETNRLTTAGHQAAELSKSVQLVSEKLDTLVGDNNNTDTDCSGGGGGGKRSLSVKDLVVLDRARDELRRQEVAVERLRKDCFLVHVQFHPAGTSVDKVLRELTVGALTVEETKSQPGGGGSGGRSGGWRGARPRVQRFVSDPSSSMLPAPFVDNASLPAQQRTNSPDVFDNAPPPRGPSRQGRRALSPPGAGASSLSSSPSEGQASGGWDAYREQHPPRRRSEGPTTAFSAMRRAPKTAPDFGSVLIEESRRSRSQPRRARPLSEGSSSLSSSATPRRRGPPMETAIDGGSESERNVPSSRPADRIPAGAPSRAEIQAQGSTARTERSVALTPTTATTTEPHPISSEDDLSSLDTTTNVTFVENGDNLGATNAASTEREPPQAGSDSDTGAGHSSRRIVCVRNFLANHGSDVKNHPGLVGICAVCRDRVAVSDRWNKVVKLLDISGRVMDVLVIAGTAEPWDLALRRPGVLAVTYPKEQKIRMVDIADGASRMHYRSHFMTRDGYASLAALDPATLIASVCPPFGSPKVHVLDYMGAVLRALDCSQLAYPRCLDVCGGDQVCVSDWTHHNVKVFTLRSNSGDPGSGSGPNPGPGSSSSSSTTSPSSSSSSAPAVVKHTYSGVPGGPVDAQLKAPMGLAWNGRGHLFIVDGKGNRLHAVCTQSGACSAIFSLPQGLGGGELKLVTFVDASPELCRSERALVVTTTTGSVQVYDLCHSF